MIIEIEGIDGVGKTTVAKKLAALLGATYLKFPDRTSPSGEVIDQMLRDPHTHDAATFQALQVVNRLENFDLLATCLEPSERHVVCDRYKQSAFVYGGLDGLPRSWLEKIVRSVPDADLHVLLWADPMLVDGKRLAGRDREVYERRGLQGLVAQSTQFRKIWEEHANDSRWLTYRTDVVGADDIAYEIHQFCLAVMR